MLDPEGMRGRDFDGAQTCTRHSQGYMLDLTDTGGGAMQRLCAMLLGFAVSGALACGLWAQTATTPPARVQGSAISFSASFDFSEPFPAPPIVGAPYCGEQVFEHRQQLADGTNIVRPGMPPVFMCRDSQGRTRSERNAGPSGQPDLGIKIIEITDSVAGIRYVIDGYNRVVHASRFTPRPAMEAMRANITRPPRPPGTTAPAPGPSAVKPNPGLRPSTTTEDLGTKFIDNVTVEGRRMTTTLPVGMRGNDRPIVTTQETWTAPELRLTISSMSSNPASGETGTKIVNLNRSEPDPVLFQPPLDYKVVEETGPFVVRIQHP